MPGRTASPPLAGSTAVLGREGSTLPEKESPKQGKMFGAMVDEEETYERVQDLLDRAVEPDS